MRISLITITAAALADSVNPCGIAALVILLLTLLKSGRSKKIIFIGFAYVLGLFLTYFLFGLGLFQFLKLSFLAPFLHWAIGLLALYVGIKYIYDYYRKSSQCVVCESETSYKIPSFLRSIYQKLIKNITTFWGAFILGSLITLIEIPCTGGPYFFALGYIAEQKLVLIPILLFYNIITFLPLVILILLIYFGFTNIEKAREWRAKNLIRLQLITGIFMILIGIYMILSNFY
jgi:cytochrome c biogenesis protein CcdA